MIKKTFVNPYRETGVFYTEGLDCMIGTLDRSAQPTVGLVLDLATRYGRLLKEKEPGFEESGERIRPQIAMAFNNTLRFPEFMDIYELNNTQKDQIKSLMNVIDGLTAHDLTKSNVELRQRIRELEVFLILTEFDPEESFPALAASAVLDAAVGYWANVMMDTTNDWNDFLEDREIKLEEVSWENVMRSAMKGAITGAVATDSIGLAALGGLGASVTELTAMI